MNKQARREKGDEVARRKDRRIPQRPYVAPPAAEPVTIERAVEEGLLIARSALLLDITNRIIVGALRDDDDFEADRIRVLVREELLALARQYDESARRMSRLAVAALTGRGDARDPDAYGPDDYRTLTKRGQVSSLMADTLRSASDDENYLRGATEEARDRAWTDIGRAIEARLTALAAPRFDDGYGDVRAERLAAFRTLDLAPLLREGRPDQH